MVILHNFQEVLDIISATSRINLPACKPCSFAIQYLEDEESETVYGAGGPPLPLAESHLLDASICNWRRLSAKNEDYKDIYEITFDIVDSNCEFRAGDTIGIFPQNCGEDVNLIICHLDLQSKADCVYKLTDLVTKTKIPLHCPIKSTIRHFLTYCVDLRSVLKKVFLFVLSQNTKDEKEKKILEYLSSKEGSSAYNTHILNKGICILDLFKSFQTCKPPIEVLMTHLTRLLPRPYSIINSGLNDNNKIRICFSVMDTGNDRRGLTSGWLEKLINTEESLENGLENLNINDNNLKKIPLYIRKNVSNFCLPEDLETPMILIGPGTGVAPFIGFLEEREILKTKNTSVKLGEVKLFFGCRNPSFDFIYKDELNSFVDKGTLNEFHTAFSRVDEKQYVQDLLKENGKSLLKSIEDEAFIYVCGDVNKMAGEVKEAFVQILVEHGGKTRDNAEGFLNEMMRKKKYIVDVWN